MCNCLHANTCPQDIHTRPPFRSRRFPNPSTSTVLHCLMCFKSLRIPFRRRQRGQRSPAHQLTELDTQPTSSINPPTPQPAISHLPIDQPGKLLGTSENVLQDVPSPDEMAAEDAPHPTSSDWKSTTWNTTKLTLRLVKESAGVFPPLQAVAGGLCELINNFEVRRFLCKLRCN